MNELKLLTEFWDKPNLTNYLNCQDYFYKSKSFDPFEKYLEKILFEMDNKNFETVISEFKETRQLSLFMLNKVSKCYKNLHNATEQIKYFTRAAEVAQVILESGDGSRENPYKIIYGSDSKEIIPYLQEIYKEHTIIDFNGKKLEVVLTESKKDYFFEIDNLLIAKENAVQDKVNDLIKWYNKHTNKPV